MSFNKKLWDKIRSDIIANLDMERVYGSFFLKEIGPVNPAGFRQCLCPFHDDSSKSFSFAIEGKDKGTWKCFASCGQGDCFDFYSKITGKSFKQTVLKLASKANVDIPDDLFSSKKYTGKRKGKKGRSKGGKGKGKSRNKTSEDVPPIKESIVTKYQEALYSQKGLIRYLRDERGLTLKTIKHFKIGWSIKSKRYTIPIYDFEGNCRNIRKWKPQSKERKIINHQDDKQKISYGSPIRIYGHDDLRDAGSDDYVLLVEGEPDRILAHQLGFYSVTLTGGCMTSWLPGWIPYFAGKKIAICYDVDVTGKNAVQAKVLPFLLQAGLISLKNIELPLSGLKTEKDLTDWVVKHSGDKEQLLKILEDAEELIKPNPDDAKPIRLKTFKSITSDKLIGKKVKCQITVCGETSEDFHAAYKFRIVHCPLQKSGGCICSARSTDYVLPNGCREFIGSCMSSDNQVIGMLRNYCCKQGQNPTIEIYDRKTVLEFFCHQKVERRSPENLGEPVSNQELFEKRVYFISDKHPNIGTYQATGYVTSSPKTQQVTLLIEKLTEMIDDYKKFDIKKNLKLLKEVQEYSIENLVEFLRERVIKIYQRDEIILCNLLAFCSALWLDFCDETIRGWLTSVIIGDPASGKSQSYRNFANWVGIGDEFSGLTGSRTGLTYGLKEHKQKGWQVKIGRYPANNGKILLVDEVQFLKEGDVRTLSKAMEEGFLQIDRISSGGYESQTRLIMVGNPAKDRVMDAYTYGCESLAELFQPPVIRRLDIAVFASSSDIDDPSFINVEHGVEKVEAENLTAQHFRALIYWAWNLKKEEIEFEEASTQLILELSNELSDKYGHAHSIPLVNLSDIRKKIARISAAFAIVEVSMPEDSFGLIVKPEHVRLATGFLDLLYSSENAQLDEFSRQEAQKTSVEDYDEIAKEFIQKWRGESRSHRTSSSLFDKNGKADNRTFRRLVHTIRINRYISRAALAETLGVTESAIKYHITFLRKKQLIKSTNYGYIKEAKFNLFIRRFEAENESFFDFAEEYDEDDSIDPNAVF